MSKLGHPFNDHNPAGKHRIHFLIAVAGVDEGGTEFSDFGQLQTGPVEAHRPVEVGEDVQHVEGFEFFEQEIEAVSVSVHFGLFPFDQRHLRDDQLEQDVQEYSGQVGVLTAPSFAGLRRN